MGGSGVSDAQAFFGGVFFGACLGFFVGSTLPVEMNWHSERRERWAVEANHGEYFLNEEHKREFRWRECAHATTEEGK